jgi:hypothetical protein
VTRLAIVAEPDDAALHGLDGTFAWGEARTFAPGDDTTEFGPDATLALGDVEAARADARWRTRAVGGGDAAPRAIAAAGGAVQGGAVRGGDASPRRESSGGERGARTAHLIAPAGGDLWRRAVPPANDALLALRGRPGAGVLVVGGAGEAGRMLRERGREVREAARLVLDDLAAAAIVALPDAVGAAAVLAAGRVLLLPPLELTFGLVPGSDHLQYRAGHELAQLADAAAAFPDAFASVVAMGSLAVRAQLASAVYGRLAPDLAAIAAA